MKERTRSNIDIVRGDTTILTVPITTGCIRRFSLMTEDYVRLGFELGTPVHIAIGDYIQDEIFGRFVVTKEQMPQYNATTGGYTYSLQFDAEYMAWANRKMMLTAQAADGTRIRKEAQWYLTASLSKQMDELIRNVECLGYTGYSYSIEPTATRAQEVKLMTYSGTDIIQALNKMAEQWECEWWVTADKVIHLGKCQSDGEPLQFQLGHNVESMTIQDNRNTFASKVYVYGSTQNVPATYRKKLKVYVNGMSMVQGGTIPIWRTDKKLTADMFPAIKPITMAVLKYNFDPVVKDATSWEFEGYRGRATIEKAATYNLTTGRITMASASVVVPSSTPGSGTYQVSYTVRAQLILESDSMTTALSAAQASGTATVDPQQPIIILPSITMPEVQTTIYLASGDYEVYIVYTVTTDHEIRNVSKVTCSPYTTQYLTIRQGHGATGSGVIPYECEGNTGYIQINHFGEEQYRADGTENLDYYAFVFTDNSGKLVSAPTWFTTGKTLILDDRGTILVPSAYYTTEYDDPSAISKIGEARLQMPEATNGYVMLDGTDEQNAVEEVVVFDDIYPRCDLIVASIEETKRTDRREYEGEDVDSVWKWIEYTITLKQANGNDFPFKDDYILPGTKLQIKFLTPQDVQSGATITTPCQLAGMTFDVVFDGGKYTMVRNEEYGALLPSTALCPSEGDPCILVGWNPKALTGLGLIANAEQRLQSKADEYKAALEEGQFTFDCSMMSDFMFDQIPFVDLLEAEGKRVKDSQEAYIIVRNGHTVYAIHTEGTQVSITHGALKGTKQSRIIGYELKLDKPYDTPRYTIGETQAYSRLAKIEREIKMIQ